MILPAGIGSFAKTPIAEGFHDVDVPVDECDRIHLALRVEANPGKIIIGDRDEGKRIGDGFIP